MEPHSSTADAEFGDAIAGLQRGDFSRLSPFFEGTVGPGATQARIVTWHEQGRFANHPQESSEALTCACFLGRVPVADYLIARGISPAGGMGTGLNALHWAANRGQLEAVKLLLRHHVLLETRNMYEGTVLGGTVWAAIHEPRPDHVSILEALLDSGADVKEADYPTGNTRVDDVLRRFGAA
jgi:hypothetical protein